MSKVDVVGGSGGAGVSNTSSKGNFLQIFKEINSEFDRIETSVE
jgi:hypothetical protein